MGYDWDFASLWPYKAAFWYGIQLTLGLTIGASAIGTIVGVPLAILSRVKLASLLVVPTVDVLRAVPNLVLIFLFYYLPYWQLFGIKPPSAFWCALWALTVTQSAYSADLIRAAIDQVPHTHVLGLQCLGMHKLSIWRHAKLPWIVRHAFPGHVALWIGNLKLSSLASVIGVAEVVYSAKVAIAQNFRSLEAWIVVAVIYIVLVLPVTFVLRKMEGTNWIRQT